MGPTKKRKKAGDRERTARSPSSRQAVQETPDPTDRKRTLRRERWSGLSAAGAARFPGTFGRIPNFVGAESAAEILCAQPVFQRAEWLKCNPDLPQRPLRYRALLAGKRIYMAVPRLAEKRPFVLLDPRKLDPGELWRASSIRGAFELGRPVTLKQLHPVELIVTGCVGATPDGSRLGKGGGYADLEYALLRESKKAGPRTPIVTTLHSSQVLRNGSVPMLPHDISLDGYATETRWVSCKRKARRPRGILWDVLEEEKRKAIPVLARGRL